MTSVHYRVIEYVELNITIHHHTEKAVHCRLVSLLSSSMPDLVFRHSSMCSLEADRSVATLTVGAQRRALLQSLSILQSDTYVSRHTQASIITHRPWPRNSSAKWMTKYLFKWHEKESRNSYRNDIPIEMTLEEISRNHATPIKRTSPLLVDLSDRKITVSIKHWK